MRLEDCRPSPQQPRVLQGINKRGMAFRFALPPLEAGVHTLQAFVINPSGAFKQELNQSPLKFAEV